MTILIAVTHPMAMTFSLNVTVIIQDSPEVQTQCKCDLDAQTTPTSGHNGKYYGGLLYSSVPKLVFPIEQLHSIYPHF